ncbi:hypothetical protein [Coleofasciculus sp.]|uniref:hypothetical protein n=1 Tax=Coleofasciculus sp. TaxID=3100458 RepID=UPI003A3D8659
MSDLFEPKLSLIRQTDGMYILKAETQVPDTCHVAGEAVQELPPTEVIIPEALPVTLRIKYLDSQICQPVIKSVRHRIANLKLGEGKDQVIAFTTVNDRVVGSASIRLEDVDSGQESIDTSDWKAWVNRMPGPDTPALFVEGTVTLPNPCYSAQLVKADDQKDPNILMLDLQISEPKPSVFCIQVVTERTVRYEDENYTGNHEKVIIRLADNSKIQVEIDTVS